MHELIALFRIEMPLWEILVRGTAMYWFLFVLFRFVLPREVGAVGVADMLVLVLVADASQNAMAGGYDTVGEGAVLVATIVGWNALADWASWRWPRVARVLQAKPLRLVRDGRMIARNMARQFVTPEELMSKLRSHGVDDLGKVKSAHLERDGEVSVVLFESRADKPPRRPAPT